ncbi:MAG: dihydropteroate synthase [Candidatus Saganbacteria bacterium]|nr:dihydropteroate synthase [Candidatus Saganbacteria bacterium]
MDFLPRIISIEDLKEAEKELRSIGVHDKGIDIMSEKAVFRAVKIKDVPVTAANILKQDMLARGGEAATSAGTINHSVDKTDVILFGTISQYRDLIKKLSDQQFKLPQIALEIEKLIEVSESYPKPMLGMEFGKKTFVMGVLNVTPDSFSDGGEFLDVEDAAAHAGKMIEDGADIIDIGGESTRPGAEEVSAEEETKRIVPIITKIKSFAKIISVDTRKPAVAQAAVKAGANMINDVSGLHFDKDLAKIAAIYNIPLVLMHSKGSPKTMQNGPEYNDLISEIILYFKESMENAIEAGVKEENIILDPGIGFGKTVEHNIEILRRLDEFRCLGRPVCIGTSRKSFIGKILGEDDPRKREEGTAATIALAISKKVDIIRSHNTSFAKKVVVLSDAITRRD